MNIGDTVKMQHTFTKENVDEYIALGGAPTENDKLPLPLIAAMFSKLLGMDLPGIGTNYLKQSFDMNSQAFIGTPLTASVEITNIRPEKHLVDLKTLCKNESGKLICSGRALVYVRDVK